MKLKSKVLPKNLERKAHTQRLRNQGRLYRAEAAGDTNDKIIIIIKTIVILMNC